MSNPMTTETPPSDEEPFSRATLDALPGRVLLEFGAGWCGICRAAQPLIGDWLAQHGEVRHIRIEDGKGRRLGRTYAVKLWPTLILLHEGREIARAVRPNDRDALASALG